MKEKIVLDCEDILFNCLHDYEDNVGVINYKLDRKKVEKYPTNWEELKQLCKDIKKVNVCKNGYCIEFNHLRFYMDGTIIYVIGNFETESIIKVNVTVSRMWNIIKNLIGEE